MKKKQLKQTLKRLIKDYKAANGEYARGRLSAFKMVLNLVDE